MPRDLYDIIQKITYRDEDGISRVAVPKIINTDVSWQLMVGAPQLRANKQYKPIRHEVEILTKLKQ